MSPISRGFHGRRREAADSARLPPGQYLTHDFPVLSAGATPRNAPAKRAFSIEGGPGGAPPPSSACRTWLCKFEAAREPKSWTWSEFQALPAETVTVDIHCVTR